MTIVSSWHITWWVIWGLDFSFSMLTCSHDLDGACGAFYLCLLSGPGTTLDKLLPELRFRVHSEEKMDEAQKRPRDLCTGSVFHLLWGVGLGWAHTSVSIVHKQFQTECWMQPMSEDILLKPLWSTAPRSRSALSLDIFMDTWRCSAPTCSLPTSYWWDTLLRR